MATVREVFETNTFGVMAMTQQRRLSSYAEVRCRRERHVERDAGADATGGGVHRKQNGDRRVHRIARALVAEAFNVRVKLVEPGYAPTTRFTRTAGRALRDCF